MRFREGPTSWPELRQASIQPSARESIQPSVRNAVRPSVQPSARGGHSQREEREPEQQSQRNYRHASVYGGATLPRLKPENLKYNGKGPITSHVNRITYMVELYDEDSVLINLPTAMEGNAQTWWGSLQLDVKRRMGQSIHEWIDRLQTRFRAESSSPSDKLTP
jgi:hypothetical protein